MLTFHNQAGFTPGTEDWFQIQKLIDINIIHQLTNKKNPRKTQNQINHVIISIDAEKALENFSTHS